VDELKVSKGAVNIMYPCPVTLVTCRDKKGEDNIIAIAWIGVLGGKPPMIGMGFNKSRHSTGIIEESGEFVVNIPDEKLLAESDWCGCVSGRDFDKFEKAGLTKEPASKVKAPLIKECPVSIECVVREKLTLGDYRVFIGEIVETHVEKSALNEKGDIDFSKVSPVLYNVGEYWGIGGKKANIKFAEKFSG
jgi:flavin reductase (DIM6/NTAB) family NADH-FMN oxidoreductase RutF